MRISPRPYQKQKNNQSRNLNSAPPGPSEKKNRNRILDSSPTARVIKPTLSSALKARQRHGAQGILGRLCGAKFYSGFPRAATAISPGGGVLGSSFAGYVPLASQNPYPIIVYSVASYRHHLKSLLGKCHCDSMRANC